MDAQLEVAVATHNSDIIVLFIVRSLAPSLDLGGSCVLRDQTGKGLNQGVFDQATSKSRD